MARRAPGHPPRHVAHDDVRDYKRSLLSRPRLPRFDRLLATEAISDVRKGVCSEWPGKSRCGRAERWCNGTGSCLSSHVGNTATSRSCGEFISECARSASRSYRIAAPASQRTLKNAQIKLLAEEGSHNPGIQIYSTVSTRALEEAIDA